MKRFFILFFLILTSVVFFILPSLWAQEKVRVTGSTTVLPIAQKAAESFMAQRPGILITVAGTGTGDGLKTILGGYAEIANASRDLKGPEKNLAAKHHTVLVKHIVALDCIAVIVHPGNPINNLSIQQLHDIYVGNIKNWQELGGVDKKIVAINRDTSSGTFELWLDVVLKGKRARVDALVQPSGGGISHAVANNKYAIGYIGLGYINQKVKVLTVNGVVPSVQTAKSGVYPLSRELYMFTVEEPQKGVKEFLDYIKSPGGQRIIEDEGFVSIN